MLIAGIPFKYAFVAKLLLAECVVINSYFGTTFSLIDFPLVLFIGVFLSMPAISPNSFKYKFFSRMERHFQKLTNWARNKHHIPLEIRKKAYEKSGRLKKDPKCLDLYKDL